MIIVHLTYKAPLSEMDKYIQAHRDFLENYYKQGLLLASGPLKPRTGGIILAASKDKAAVEAIFKNDPWYLADIASYEFTEFVPVKHCAELAPMIQKMEGKLC